MKIYIGNHRKWAKRIEAETHSEVIVLPDHQNLNHSVRNHSDMLCCPVGNTVILAPETAAEFFIQNKGKIHERNLEVISGQTKLLPEYPKNIAYNVAFVGRFAVHNFDHTDLVLKNRIAIAGYKQLNVKQGYTNCSMLVIDDTHVVTADEGVKKVLETENIEVLKIQPGCIELPGLNYGFIGGAGFCFKNTVYLFGNLDRHPEGERIGAFIHEAGKTYNCLSDEKLIDIGSCRVVNT